MILWTMILGHSYNLLAYLIKCCGSQEGDTPQAQKMKIIHNIDVIW